MHQVIELLEAELYKRQQMNSSYSLRAFAKFLGVSPATLSQVLSEKRKLGRKGQEKILKKLGLEHDLKEVSLTKIDKVERLTVEKDIFELIAKWHYYAILSLSEVKGSKSDPRWVARRLGISVSVANQAMQRLERLGIIELDKEEGTFRQVSAPLKTTDDIPSTAIQKYHQSLLGLAQLKIEEVPVEEREFRSITFACNSKKIKKAKKIINELKDLVSEAMESGTKDSVYQFSIQLFPLSKGKSK